MTTDEKIEQMRKALQLARGVVDQVAKCHYLDDIHQPDGSVAALAAIDEALS
jgi:hypothetical protein